MHGKRGRSCIRKTACCQISNLVKLMRFNSMTDPIIFSIFYTDEKRIGDSCMKTSGTKCGTKKRASDCGIPQFRIFFSFKMKLEITRKCYQSSSSTKKKFFRGSKQSTSFEEQSTIIIIEKIERRFMRYQNY